MRKARTDWKSVIDTVSKCATKAVSLNGQSIYALARLRTQQSIERVAARKTSTEPQPTPEPPKPAPDQKPAYVRTWDRKDPPKTEEELAAMTPAQRYYWRHKSDPGFMEKHREACNKCQRLKRTDPNWRDKRKKEHKEFLNRKKNSPEWKAKKNAYLRDWRHKKKQKQLEARI